MLSAFLLFSGFCVFIYSSIPVIVKEPYLKTVTKTKEDVLTEGTISAYSIFYSKTFNFNSGDRIFITASIEEGTLSAGVYDYFESKEIASQENVKTVSIDVTVPRSGYYEIYVRRYKKSIYEFFLSKVNANVKITTITTEQYFVQDYREKTTYPYKDYETTGIALMLAGIGVGVLSIAQDRHYKGGVLNNQVN